MSLGGTDASPGGTTLSVAGATQGGVAGGVGGAGSGGDTVSGGTSAGGGAGGSAGESFAAATLSMLSVSSGELFPAFDPNETEYTLKIAPLGAAVVTVTAQSADEGAAIAVNGGPLVLDFVGLQVYPYDDDEVTFDVVAAGRSGNRYVLHVEQAAHAAITIDPIDIASFTPGGDYRYGAHAWDYFGRKVAIGTGFVALGGPGHDFISGNEPPQPTSAGGVDILIPGPVTPWIKPHRLWGSARAMGSEFGSSIATDGELLLVGSPGDLDVKLQGGIRCGAAYLFRSSFEGSTISWKQVARFLPPVPVQDARFGGYVAIRGDTIAIGSGRNDVDLFRAVGVDEWEHEKTITVPSLNVAIALSDEHLVVGRADRTCGASNAIIYEKGVGRAWTQRCTVSDDIATDPIQALALDGNRLVLASNKTFVLFENAGSTWALVNRFGSPDANFGNALALRDGRLFIGAPADKSPALGIDGDATQPVDATAPAYGAVYSFRQRRGESWVQDAYIKPGGVELAQVAWAGFGQSLAYDGQMLVVGAPYFDASVSAPEPAPGQPPTLGDPAGGAFIYR